MSSTGLNYFFSKFVANAALVRHAPCFVAGMNSDVLFVSPDAPIVDAIQAIERGGAQIAIVVDENRRLLGTVTDGDVRRALLRGQALTDPVRTIMATNPSAAPAGSDDWEQLRLMRQMDVRQLPLLDFGGRVADIRTLKDLMQRTRRPNHVVLMAGGLGSRLSPLTDSVPKPMLQVGGKPLLQTILESFVDHGFEHFHISLNYRGDMIRQHFGDGGRWNVRIDYLEETQRMGTAGSLTLLPERPKEPFFIMNGDVLTSVNFGQILQFHSDNGAVASMAVHEHAVQVPYGVVEVSDHDLVKITEKPTHNHFINAGIYLLSPEALDRIPRDTFYDMPTLYQTLLREGQKVIAFPIWEYWLDIGQPHDLLRAEQEFGEVFGQA